MCVCLYSIYTYKVLTRIVRSLTLFFFFTSLAQIFFTKSEEKKRKKNSYLVTFLFIVDLKIRC